MWWVPGTDRRVAGEFTFQGRGQLVTRQLLDGDLDSALISWLGSREAVIPLIHGRTFDGVEVSLLDCRSRHPIGSNDDPGMVFHVELAVVGCHVGADTFARAKVQFDYLPGWAEPPGFADDKAGPRRKGFSFEFGELVLDQFHSDGFELLLVHGPEGSASDRGIAVQQYVAVVIEVDQPQTAKDLVQGWVRPLQNLLTVCAGIPVRLTHLHLWPSDATGYETVGAAHFASVQTKAAEKLRHLRSYDVPTLLTRTTCPIGLCDLMHRWLAFSREHRALVSGFIAPFYVDFAYLEHRFSSTINAAEALHRAFYEGRELPKREHAARVGRIVDAARAAGVDAADVAWANRVLRSRNDKPLKTKVEELVRDAGLVGERITAAYPNFIEEVVAARTGVSHGAASTRLDSAALYWRLDLLRWLVRVAMLRQLDLPLATLEAQVVGNGQFQFALDPG